ncbi:Thiosulfate sulfurtransferase, rhodanese [Thioalkalivibrio nitratireducens DSM 14787]|uniref:Thiosulfate sulfurtransferase, rhodanese n=1 Tax=Thioalkalivibrio nitratireducens (strain DSM 14787 / UNIQEM 213 / ALEN2) TaxID=1255043 RepID=L0DUG1_THIND|nr:rhodanese-like domain-containing protein [Thioalkalivibrio nitratireducens]AGA32642.1 Thiosulfate sulfurtransferase, rhodanese [Thioalkalivibrio nitratireducens DSM 14787]
MHLRTTTPFKWAALLAGLLLFATAAKADRPGFLVDSTWLEDHIDDPSLVLLEVRYYPSRYFSVGHIPGARQVQRFADLGDNHAVPVMRYPSMEAFQETLRGWGVNDDSLVVIYDDSRTALASRIYFLLDLYGFDMERVKIMDGATTEWEAFNDLSTEPPEVTPGNVTLEPAREGLVIEWTDIYRDVYSLRNPNIVLLDARPENQYTGEVMNGAVRAGHIPGAVNVEGLQGTDGQKWRPLDQVAAMYADIPKDKTVYAYCHDGFRNTMAYIQLKALGYEDVRLYNGGWAHWGNELSLPVVMGDEPWDAAHAL